MEQILFDELSEIIQKHYPQPQETQLSIGNSGVFCSTKAINFNLLYYINLYSRIAGRVLWRVGEGYYRSDLDIFHLAKRINWEDYFGVDNSLRVDVTAVFSPLKSITIAALRTKDAICDQFRERHNRRPDVEKKTPDIRIRVYLEKNRCAFYLDTSGEPLFKRGYRARANSPTAAPIRENLAAGLLRIINWQAQNPLLDPFCGSGTFAIEAMQIAINHPPGLGRKFAFEKLKQFNINNWRELLQKAHEEVYDIESLKIKPQIIIGDIDGEILSNAQEIIKSLDFQDLINTYQGEFQKFDNSHIDINHNPILIANPPYGERMGDKEKLINEYQQWGRVLKHQYAGWKAGFITADNDFIKGLGLKPKTKFPVMNGDLEARFYIIPLFAGARKEVLAKQHEEH